MQETLGKLILRLAPKTFDSQIVLIVLCCTELMYELSIFIFCDIRGQLIIKLGEQICLPSRSSRFGDNFDNNALDYFSPFKPTEMWSSVLAHDIYIVK